ncbi:retrotransposon gag protein domain-containing protein [Phthorimaea operculella]|nr:retrotransposon gag protein domain-containing protein [Phthorimaea operculella]
MAMETHPIKYFLLKKNELSYEVTIRGEEPAATVLELRKQITKLTALIPNEDIEESGIAPAVDIIGLETSITDYNSKVQSQKTKFDANACKRIEALGLHIHFRLKRFDKSDQTVNTRLKILIDIYRTAYAELEELTKSREDTEQPKNNPDPPLESTECDHYKVGNLLKLKYDGTSSVHAFIQKVKDISTSRNIPSHRLLAYGTEIFTGNALHWFRGIKDTIKSWDDLEKLLIADFSHFDYDYRLMTEIRNRTQGDSENIAVYFSIMSQLFSRLSKPLSEDDKLQILLHNIKPCYASVIASASATTSINTIDSLRTICRNFENVQCYTSQYREPPRVTQDTLAPDLAFVKATTSSSNNRRS